MPALSAPAVAVVEPPDVVATVYSPPSLRPSTVTASAETVLVSVQLVPSAPVTVIVSPSATGMEADTPTSVVSPLASTDPSIDPAAPPTTTSPPVTWADPLESIPSELA